MMRLYGYFRSSAAYRVRIALAIKKISVENSDVDLRLGEQKRAEYRKVNPQALVPALGIDDEVVGQSLAIIEYLNECYPEPPLLPDAPLAAAKVRSLCYHIAMDIHPLNNLRVLQYLSDNLSVTDRQKQTWYEHWIAQGFESIERMLENVTGDYCCGDSVSLADICLIPQLYNARRFNCDLSDFPKILSVEQVCLGRPDFLSAAPDQQI